MPGARGILSNMSVTAPADSATNALNIMKATAEVTKPSLGKKSSKKGKAQSNAEKEVPMSKKSEDKDSRFLIDWINYTFDRMQLISSSDSNFNGDETMDNMSFNASMISVNQKNACQEYAYGIKQQYENETDETLRKAAYELYCSDSVLGVIKKVEKAVERSVFAIREDREVELDLGLQESFFDLIFSYDLAYLSLSVQIVLGSEKISQKKKKTLRASLKSTIIAKLFKCEVEVGDTFRKNNTLKAVEKKKKELLNQHILKKFLSLVLFLDQSRLLAVLTKGTLFTPNSIFKSSRDILTNFCTLLLKSEGEFLKHLGNLGYSVSFTQTYLDEFDFKVNDLRVDLRDGVRLVRLYELLCGVEESRNNELSSQLRVPAISRLQKIHNNRLLLDTLQSPSAETDSKKLADGDYDLILIILWKLLFNFELNKFLTKEKIHNEITLLRREIPQKLEFSDVQKVEFSTQEEQQKVEFLETEDFASLLLTWIQLVVEPYGLAVYDLTDSLADGSLLAFVINYYHPSLLPLVTIKEAPVEGSSNKHESKYEKHNWKCIKLATKAIGGIPTTLLFTSTTDHDHPSSRNPPGEENMLIFLTRFFMRLTESANQIRAVCVLQRWCRARFPHSATSGKGEMKGKKEVMVRQHATSRFRRAQSQGQSVQARLQARLLQQQAQAQQQQAQGTAKGGEKKESRFAQWRRANNTTSGSMMIMSKSPKLIMKASSATTVEEEEEEANDENSPVPLASSHSLVDDINDAVKPLQQQVVKEEEEQEEAEEAWVDLSAVLAVHKDTFDDNKEGEDEHQLDDLLGLLSDDEGEDEEAAAALALAEAESAAAATAQQKQAEEEKVAEQEQQRLILLELEQQASALALAKQQQEEEAAAAALALAEQEAQAVAEAAALAAAIAEEEEKERQRQALLLQQQLEEEEAVAAAAALTLATAEFEAALELAKQQEREGEEAEAAAIAAEAEAALALQLQLEKEAEAAAAALAKAEAEAEAAAIAAETARLEKEQAEAVAIAAAIAKAEAEAAQAAAIAEAVTLAEAEALITSEVASLLTDMTNDIMLHQASILHMADEIIDSLITSSLDEVEILQQRRLFEAELARQLELQQAEEEARIRAQILAQQAYEVMLQHCAMIITQCFKRHHVMTVSKMREEMQALQALKYQQECETASAICLQSHMRRFLSQKKFRCAILAVSILQAMHRKKSILRTFKLMHIAATKITAVVRGFLARQQVLNAETRVLLARQQAAKAVIRRVVCVFLLQKKCVKAVCMMQKMVRAKVFVMWKVKKMLAVCKHGMNQLKVRQSFLLRLCCAVMLLMRSSVICAACC